MTAALGIALAVGRGVAVGGLLLCAVVATNALTRIADALERRAYLRTVERGQ